jgi:hypothetical protein
MRYSIEIKENKRLIKGICFPAFFAGVLAMLAIILCFTLAHASEYTEYYSNEQIANAIYLAEGGAHTMHPYGVLAHYRNTTPRQACINTIKHARRDFKGGDFIAFLGSRYCPVGCDNDRGTNKYWVRNVKALLQKVS